MNDQEVAIIQLRERLAALEHEQWVHWTRYFLANLTSENIARWQTQCSTPYDQLSELEKDSDRNWADKVLDLLKEFSKEMPTRISES